MEFWGRGTPMGGAYYQISVKNSQIINENEENRGCRGEQEGVIRD
jgi:hypothetical protein